MENQVEYWNLNKKKKEKDLKGKLKSLNKK